MHIRVNEAHSGYLMHPGKWQPNILSGLEPKTDYRWIMPTKPRTMWHTSSVVSTSSWSSLPEEACMQEGIYPFGRTNGSADSPGIFLQHLETISCRFLKIFSDNQSTVGILTLNCKETGYKNITTEIRQTITTLQQNGAEVDISWTPAPRSCQYLRKRNSRCTSQRSCYGGNEPSRGQKFIHNTGD